MKRYDGGALFERSRYCRYGWTFSQNKFRISLCFGCYFSKWPEVYAIYYRYTIPLSRHCSKNTRKVEEAIQNNANMRVLKNLNSKGKMFIHKMKNDQGIIMNRRVRLQKLLEFLLTTLQLFGGTLRSRRSNSSASPKHRIRTTRTHWWRTRGGAKTPKKPQNSGREPDHQWDVEDRRRDTQESTPHLTK